MVRLFVFGLLTSVLLSTTGCTSAAIAVIDEKISQMTEMDCTSVNVMLGESYCQDKLRNLKQEEVYCYKTLGGVDCYRDKNPYKTEKSNRVRAVTALGSEGAKIEYLSENKDKKKLFNVPFVEAKAETLKTD
ncbi:MAG: hypothetical protein JKX94_09880 [Sneathiella sp.]|nr:hypothetical protein [Sneathiella sp.]